MQQKKEFPGLVTTKAIKQTAATDKYLLQGRQSNPFIFKTGR